MISETIEFCLWHEKDIKLALEERRDGARRGGVTGGNGSGHMQVSDPTAIQAMRNIAVINVLDVPYGCLYGKAPVYNEKTGMYAPDRRWQETYRLRHPEKWLRVVVALKQRYLSDDCSLKDFFERRYIKKEDWKKTCEELKISRSMYYAMKGDVIRAGEVYAAGYGAASAGSILR